MKRSKLFIILILGLLSLTAAAQNWQIKIGGGLASQYSDKKVVGAFKLGVGAEFELDQHWAFNPGLNFYAKGWKNKDEVVNIFDDNGNPVVDENGNPVTGLMARSVTANYLEIPLLMNYYIRLGAKRYLVIGAGPYVACGIAGNIETKGDSQQQGADKLFYKHKTFDSDGVHRFDAGVQTILGYQFPMGVTLGLEADFGLTKFSSEGGRNISGLISFTYTFGK